MTKFLYILIPFVILLLFTYEKDGFPNRYGSEEIYFFQEHNGGIQDCFVKLHLKLLKCLIGEKSASPTFAVFGDSHAFVLTNELDRVAKERQLAGVVVRSQDCILPGLIEVHDSEAIEDNKTSCANTMDAWELFIKNNEFQNVILIARWTQRFYPVPGEIETLEMTYEDGGSEQENRYREYGFVSSDNKSSDLSDAIADLVEMILLHGKRLIIVGPVPTYVNTTSDINYQRLREGKEVQMPITQSYETYFRRHRYAISILKKFQNNERVSFIDSSLIFCEDLICYQQKQKPLYFDEDHLNSHGAIAMVEEIMNNVK